MSAKLYCDPDHNYETFEELCPEAQVLILFQILCIPLVAVGSILTIVTVFLVKKLHKPYDFVMCAIAMIDLVVAVCFTPLQIAADVPSSLIVSQRIRWTCALVLNFSWFCGSSALDLLTILSLVNCLMVNAPIFYINHVTKRRTVRLIVAVISTRLVVNTIPTIYDYSQRHSETDWKIELCYAHNSNLGQVAWIDDVESVILVIQIVMCLAMCVQMIHLAWKKRATQSFPQNKLKAIRLTSLACSFLILWIPTFVHLAWVQVHAEHGEHHDDHDDEDGGHDEHDDHDDHKDRPLGVAAHQGRIWRLVYHGLNGPICAATRQIYWDSFRFLLTTSPRSWRDLSKWLNLRNMTNYDTTFQASRTGPTTSVGQSPGVARSPMPNVLEEGESQSVIQETNATDECSTVSITDDNFLIATECRRQSDLYLVEYRRGSSVDSIQRNIVYQ